VVLAIPFIAFVFGIMATFMFPDSAQWMGGIVCSSPYHLAGHWGESPGRVNRTVGFDCVSGDSSYSVSHFAVFGLQTLPVALVLYFLFLFSFLLWRLSLKRR
jgi:hypothetical protein